MLHSKNTMENYLKCARISELLARSFGEKLTAEESAELDGLLEMFPFAARIGEKALEKDEIVGKVRSYDRYDSERVWSELSARLTPRKRTPGYGRWLRYAAVVIPVLILSIAYIVRNSAGPEKLTAYSDRDPSYIQLYDAATGGYVTLDTLQGLASQQLEELGLQTHDDFQLDYTAGTKDGRTHTAYHTVSIPRGKDYRIKLSDGSVVWIFAGSELSYPTRFTDDRREVRLRGEAFFEVEPDPRKPFIVKTDHCDVKVLGTAFNVKSYDEMDVVEVSLAQGSVEVEGHLLEPDNQLRFDKATGEVSYLPVNGTNYILRTRNMFVFEDMKLEEIMEELMRWYDFEPVFADEKLSGKRFGLKVKRSENLDFILHILQLTGEVKFTTKDGKIHITGL